MLYLSVIVIILLATVFMVSVGDRLNLPWPVMMTLLGAAALFIPNRPELTIDSDIILPIFLPPLLWAIGVKFSWGTLRRRWKSVLLYSVLLTTVSALAIAGAAMWWVPGMTIAVALAVGAAVSPPDPVAVEAVAEPVGIPRRLIGTLQTEGSFNDAIAIVLFHAAIHSMTNGHHIDPLSVAKDFVLGSILAVIIGYIFGWLGGYVRQRAHDVVTSNAVTLVIPFGAYLAAESVHASGVIAVVIGAIQFTSTKYMAALEAEERLTATSFWQLIELLMTGVAFGLIGLQASNIIATADSTRITSLFVDGAMVAMAAILVRLVWFTLIWLAGRKNPIHEGAPESFAEVIVMTWSGMRGLVTLVLALSIPVVNGTEQIRQDAIVMMISVLFFTLVLPGLTLPLLVKVLGVRANHEEETAVPELLKIAQAAALDALQAEAKTTTDPETYARLKEMCAAITRRDEISEALPEEYKQHMQRLKDKRSDFVRLRDAALTAAQNEVIAAQDRYDAHDVTRVVRKLDILAQAESIRSSGAFILPAMTAGAVALERYNLWKQYPNHPGCEERAFFASALRGGERLTLSGRLTAGRQVCRCLCRGRYALELGKGRLTLNHHLK